MIPVVIPAYEPGKSLVDLISELKARGITDIVVVNDGSGAVYDPVFRAAEDLGATVLKHDKNRGKGRALKTAFAYCLASFPNMIGCVTADSDGQHTAADIEKCILALRAEPVYLYLGTRDFGAHNKDGIPVKSRMGNRITSKVFATLNDGCQIRDTQTGLRAIPATFMAELADCPGERFEFEMNMLTEAVNSGIHIKEIPIETIYDSKDDHATHFRPLQDSVIIYGNLFKRFFRFAFSGLVCFGVDIALFQLFCIGARGISNYIILSAVGARLISAVCNYCLNYYYVYKSRREHTSSAPRYILLAAVQMAASAFLTAQLYKLMGPGLPEAAAKIPVDTCLFFVSFFIQKKWCFQ